jgi:prolyl-tRNA editing enzyme YbaK/EbsC (Cys-tRNA(Pro) deacylase)
MTERWPDPVERVAAFLRETGAEARIEEFSEQTPTAEDAANAVGCRLAQIVKTLVFDCDGRTVLVLVPGDRRADRRKVAVAAGCERARVAGPDRVREATGFEPGAVAPFPHPRLDRVLIDPRLLAYDSVWIGAGSENHLAALPPSELVRLSRAQTADVSEDTPL